MSDAGDLLDLLSDAAAVIGGAVELAEDLPDLAEKTARGGVKVYRKGRELGVAGGAAVAAVAVAGVAATRRRAGQANQARTAAGITPDRLREAAARGRSGAAPLLTRAQQSGRNAAARLRGSRLLQRAPFSH